MAGHSMEEGDNPVAINITAMVDVIFCLCLFFMCSFHFKQLEGRIDAWLPAHGQQGPTPKPTVLEEIRVSMTWDADAGATRRRIGSQPLANDAELVSALLSRDADYRKSGRTAPVLIDATSDVPWNEVVHVTDLCMMQRLERVEFVAPLEGSR